MTTPTAATTTAPHSATQVLFRTDRATLAHALTTVGLGLARRPAVPMLGGVLLEGRDGDLTLTTTDRDTVAIVRVPGAALTTGRVLIDHTEAIRLLAALVSGRRKADADTAPVTVSALDDGTAVLELGGYTVPVTSYRPQDFPTLPNTPPVVAKLDREQFTTDARRVLVAAGTDETVLSCLGVQMQITPGSLTLAGTDRFRLAIAKRPASTTEERTVRFPAPVLSAALKHVTAPRVHLGVRNDGNQEWVSLNCGDLTVITRLITAPFPSAERLFPDAGMTAHADLDALTHATARAGAALRAKQYTGTAAHVALTIDPTGTVSISPVLHRHTDAVTAPAHPAAVDGASEPTRVLIAAPYLRDALAAMTGDTARIQLTSPTHPVLFTGADAPAYRHLVMPVRDTRS